MSGDGTERGEVSRDGVEPVDASRGGVSDGGVSDGGVSDGGVSDGAAHSDGTGAHAGAGEVHAGAAKGGSGSLEEAGRPVESPPRRSPARLFARLLLVGLILASALGLLVIRGLAPVSETPDMVEFEVMPGWGASRVAQELEAHDVIRSATLFSAYLRLRDLDRSIGEGLYDLDRSEGAIETARKLVSGGRPRVHTLVLPEGIRAEGIAQRLEEAELGSAEEYLRLIEDPGALAPGFLPEDAGLEGYLFPASYQIPLSAEPAQVLERMVARFEEELEPEVLDELEAVGLSVHDWVILASMVQSESGGDEEMPLIAGVFLNRLDLGMPLQSDPTVAYGLGKALPELDAVAGDLRSDHPWNTYTRNGLPAGPISNPGSQALRSVLEPVRTNAEGEQYLYFLHGFEGGEPAFRPNTRLEDHNSDVQRFLRGD